MPPSVSAVVLAAGQGTRMASRLPKPLHQLCGRPMVLHIIGALADLGVARVIVVVGHGREQVIAAVTAGAPEGLEIEFVEQAEQRGTGDAVVVALAGTVDLGDDDDILVVPGDTPLLRTSTLASLIERHQGGGAAATLLSAVAPDPTGYGRVVRGSDGVVARIVEQADASEDEKAILEVNTSIYCFRRDLLATALARLDSSNAQGELYLTDVIRLLGAAGHRCEAITVDDDAEVAGVNDRSQLAEAQDAMRQRIVDAWLHAGVTMSDPEGTLIDVEVVIGDNVWLRDGVSLSGRTTVGDGCVIGPDASLNDVVVGQQAVIGSITATSATIGDAAVVGSSVIVLRGAAIPQGAVVPASTTVVP